MSYPQLTAIVAMKKDPRFNSLTLFPKRNATFKKNTELALAAMGFQLFGESCTKMHAQIIEYPEKPFDIFYDWVFCLLLPGAFLLVDMTWGH